MAFASDITEKKRLINAPEPYTCGRNPCITSSATRLLIRKACINSATAGPVTLSGVPVVAGGGSGYAVGDYIELVGGSSTTQPVLLYVSGISGNAVSTVVVVNSSTYSSVPVNPVASVTKSGSGSGATFTAVWTASGRVLCVACD